MLKISDIMKTDVIAFRPEDTLGHAIATICDRQISGGPVTSENGTLLGVISEFALMDVLFDPSLKDALVSQYMSEDVYTLSKDDSLTQAIHMFVLYRVRRLPVVQNGKLVGIVSRRDLLNQCSRLEQPLVEPLQEFMPQLLKVAQATRLDCEGTDNVGLL